MLRSFRLANHRSFRDEHELLLLPTYEQDESAVPVAAIYGANASGKSNLLDGLRFMSHAVTSSFGAWPAAGGVPRQPFRLDAESRDTSSGFVVELIAEGVRYTYGFTADSDRIVSEWLYSYPERRQRVLFERDEDGVKIGSTVPELRAKIGVLQELTRPNALFLSLAAQSNVASLLPIHQWFARRIVFSVDGEDQVDEVSVANFLRTNHGLRSSFLDLLRAADLGIADLVIGEESQDGAVPDAIAQRDTRDDDEDPWVLEIDIGPSAVRKRNTRAYLREVARIRRRLDHARSRVRLVHGKEGELFELHEESAGTRSWLTLLPTVLTVLAEGATLVVDEIDTSLHPRLTARLVGLFQDRRTNPQRAQLIFTTHDTSLLGTMLGEEVLKRDQVWFVQKESSGASVLYPLTDFHPRREENTERRYLGGSYGAVPVVSQQEFIDAVVSAGQ